MTHQPDPLGQRLAQERREDNCPPPYYLFDTLTDWEAYLDEHHPLPTDTERKRRFDAEMGALSARLDAIERNMLLSYGMGYCRMILRVWRQRGQL